MLASVRVCRCYMCVCVCACVCVCVCVCVSLCSWFSRVLACVREEERKVLLLREMSHIGGRGLPLLIECSLPAWTGLSHTYRRQE